jgi:hypothetical protein
VYSGSYTEPDVHTNTCSYRNAYTRSYSCPYPCTNERTVAFANTKPNRHTDTSTHSDANRRSNACSDDSSNTCSYTSSHNVTDTQPNARA